MAKKDSCRLGFYPIELTDFRATLQSNNTVRLLWTVASWQEVATWEIQRSTNGHRFISIGQVSPDNSTGQSQLFRFIDVHPQTGINYYRLKMKDLNGSFTYSHSEQVTIHPAFTMTAEPNVVDDQLLIQFNLKQPMHELELTLTDYYGVTVFAKNIHPNSGGFTETVFEKTCPQACTY